MLTLIGQPQGAEWLVILIIGAVCVLLPVALVVWAVVAIARRPRASRPRD